MRQTLLAFLLMLAIDDHSITFDEHIEFAKLRTFAIRSENCDSTRPELNNPLYMKKLADTIRAALSAKGMKESVDQPDIYVDYRIDGMEVSTTDRPAERARGGVLYQKGMVTVDLFRREPALLIWKGIYHDEESNGSKLAQALPVDIQKLLAQYPPKK